MKKESSINLTPLLIGLVVGAILVAFAVGYWLVQKSSITSKETRKPALKLIEQEPSTVVDSIEPAPSPQDQNPPEPAQRPIKKSSIRGTVLVAGSETRVPRASVSLYQEDRLAQVLSDSVADFRFEDILPGSYVLSATAEGYAVVRSFSHNAEIECSTGEEKTGLRVYVAPAATISGQVQTAAGVPLSNALVRVAAGRTKDSYNLIGSTQILSHPYLPLKKELANVLSDASGSFTINGLEKGTYSLVACASGYAWQTQKEVQTGQTDVVFKLEPESVIEGRVLRFPDNALIPNSTVELNIMDPNTDWACFRHVTLDGHYHIGGIQRASSIKVRAVSSTADSCMYSLLLPTVAETIQKDLVVIPSRTINLKVVDAITSKPVQGVKIWLSNFFTGPPLEQSLINLSYSNVEQALAMLTASHPFIGETDSNGIIVVKTNAAQNRIVFNGPEGYPGVVSQEVIFEDNSPSREMVIKLTSGVTISGRVIDSEMRSGISGAAILLKEISGIGREFDKVESGPNGKFVFDAVPPGTYILGAEQSGYRSGYYGNPDPNNPAALPRITIEFGKPLENCDIRLEPLPKLSLIGRVVDPNGEPIVGAKVSCLEPQNHESGLSGDMLASPEGMSKRGSMGLTETSSDGRFRLQNIPVGRYTLEVEHPDFWKGGIESLSVLAKSKLDDLKIVLDPKKEMTITGKVTFSNGSPIGNCLVFAVQGRSEALFSMGILDSEGFISGSRSTAGFPSFNSSTMPGMPVSSESTQQTGNTDPGKANTLTSPDGSYILGGLRPGKYTIYTLYKGSSDYRYDVDAGAIGVDLVIPPGGTIKGIVLLADGITPCQQFTISPSGVISRLFPSGAFEDLIPRNESFSNADGSFELTDLPEGRYSLQIDTQKDGQAFLSSIEVIAGQSVEHLRVVLGGGSVIGRVVDTNREPVGDVNVHLDNNLNMKTGSDGTFSFSGLQFGNAYTLTVEGSPPRIFPGIRVQGKEQVNLGDIVLTDGGGIEGRVRYASGEGVPGCQIELEPEPDNSGMSTGSSDKTQTDRDGQFVLNKLAPGNYRVNLRRIDKREFANSFGPVVQSKKVAVVEGKTYARVEFILDEGVRLSGRVTRGGQPLDRSTLVLYPRFQTEVQEFTTLTDQHGNYAYEGVPPGSYEAVISEFALDPADTKSISLSVPEGQDYQHNFDF